MSREPDAGSVMAGTLGGPRPKRNAERSKRAILDAALKEFSEFGHDGARIDSIARRAGVSKPLLYAHFGDKSALYAAALRAAYVQIRQAEQELNLQAFGPEESIRELVRFTLNHFREKPWFISMLNTENLRGGTTIRQISDAAEIQSPLIELLRSTLAAGIADGMFRDDVDPVDIYITIASLCYFPISNRHTLRAVFDIPLDDAWIDRHAVEIGELVIRYVRKDASDD